MPRSGSSLPRAAALIALAESRRTRAGASSAPPGSAATFAGAPIAPAGPSAMLAGSSHRAQAAFCRSPARRYRCMSALVACRGPLWPSRGAPSRQKYRTATLRTVPRLTYVLSRSTPLAGGLTRGRLISRLSLPRLAPSTSVSAGNRDRPTPSLRPTRRWPASASTRPSWCDMASRSATAVDSKARVTASKRQALAATRRSARGR